MESVDKDVMSRTATAISNQWREPWKKSENNHREVEPSEELVSSECKKKKKSSLYFLSHIGSDYLVSASQSLLTNIVWLHKVS